ncbi:phage gp6-like head-tail connector protein [Streptomyces sp. WAC01280]|uniref:phage gp6-like head-tail connector protein n=1 Tax=Streptomyces sp. WAC01280 TaxID=2487424 RepID=UPI000F7AA169|nr:phage gp6-like head-tail connector protein [Streptomyces sp. WAC01280]RSS51372.1 phage gp6-like head-tail connector protein [Streptomyces sp. WAC01280]
MADYGSVAALKERLNIEAADTSRDTLLASALAAASRAIDKATGRRFWLDDVPAQRVFNPRGRVASQDDGDLLLVDDIGSITGLIVELGSGGSYAPVTGYETSPDNALADGQAITGLLRVLGTWGTATTRVRITARFGWPAVPDAITEAALIQAARLYRRKDSPEGVTGSAEWGVVRLSRRDPDVWNLIEPYTLPGFG